MATLPTLTPMTLQRTKTESPNQSAAAIRRPAGQLDGSGDLTAIVAADRAFPSAVAELGRWFHESPGIAHPDAR